MSQFLMVAAPVLAVTAFMLSVVLVGLYAGGIVFKFGGAS